MFPLKTKQIGGYIFGQRTSYSAHHLGVDYKANYDPLYAPFNGTISQSIGAEGGKTITFKPDGQDVVMRFMHLFNFKANGRVSEGTLIGTTGCTGSLCASPHLHLDISKHEVNVDNFNNFINPETYNWTGDNGMRPMLFRQKNDPTVRFFFHGKLLPLANEEDARVIGGDNWAANVTELDKFTDYAEVLDI